MRGEEEGEKRPTQGGRLSEEDVLGKEGRCGSLRETRQMEESDSYNSLKVSLERERDREREGGGRNRPGE